MSKEIKEIINITPTGISKKSERFDLETRYQNGQRKFFHVHKIGKIIQEYDNLPLGISFMVERPKIKNKTIIDSFIQKESIKIEYFYFSENKNIHTGVYIKYMDSLYRVIHEGEKPPTRKIKSKAGYFIRQGKGPCE